MKKLFIIGNGFDLAHSIPTKYDDFHEFLKENYNDDDDFDFTIPSSQVSADGEEVFDLDDVAKFLRTAISQTEGDNWNDLEHTLGVMDYDHFLDDYSMYDDDDENPFHEVYRNEDKSSDFSGAMKLINTFFEEWIDTIDVTRASAKSSFEELIEIDRDLFFTFNYTRTLQELYNAEIVCHIHGNQGGKICFGHGNDKNYYEDYESSHIGSESNLSELDRTLRKDTKKALYDKKIFFDKLNDITHIYSYGFSYSDVDLIYIKSIIERIDSQNTIWNLHQKDSGVNTISKLKEMEIILIRNGFKGEIKRFEV